MDEITNETRPRKLSRRRFVTRAVEGGAAVLAAGALAQLGRHKGEPAGDVVLAATAPATPGFRPSETVDVTLEVNGVPRALRIPAQATLAEVLRDQLDLTGTKLGCDRGECGACTVLLDGEPVYACSTLAAAAQGHSVLTIEGIRTGEALHPIQQAFWQADGLQCGFCTPGQIMTAYALLQKNPHPSDEEIKQALAGNLCRCGSYLHILQAVKLAAGSSAS